LNSLSLTNLGRRLGGWLRDNIYKRAAFFSLWDLSHLARQAGGSCRLHWASVGLLPQDLTRWAYHFESQPLIQRSPFGAFLGLVADVRYQWRTDNLVLNPDLRVPRHSRSYLRPVSYVPWFGSSKVVATRQNIFSDPPGGDESPGDKSLFHVII
ncbi:MAG: hypothetical protein HQK55_18245, partial [Deltaproteobacteria bacterium]|nr:hypothetical protein [Deltaproteobacteria bacterium]